MMPLSENEIKAIHTEIQLVSSTKKLLARPALHAMLDLINPSFGISPAEFFRCYLARIKAVDDLVKITASDTTISEIVEIFGLNFKFDILNAGWTLAEDSILKEPNTLRRNLNDLGDGFYEEAISRIAIDIILIQCLKYVRLKHNPAKAETAFLITPSTPMKNASNLSTKTSRKPIKLYLESIISVEVPNRSAPNKKFLVRGRADLTIGYSSKDEDDALLVAVLLAKQRSEFSYKESQLIAYLAILRENRRKAGKTNIITQGLYSDGIRFGFVCIKDDGTIVQSSTWDIQAEGGLSMVFSFIVAMLETALKSTPTATEPGKQQEKEIQNMDDEVWSRVDKLIDESLRVGDDSDDDKGQHD